MAEPNPVGADALDAFKDRLELWFGHRDTPHPDGPELVYQGMDAKPYDYAFGYASAIASLVEVLDDTRYEVRSGKGIEDED